jgi:hypothetical protein
LFQLLRTSSNLTGRAWVTLDQQELARCYSHHKLMVALSSGRVRRRWVTVPTAMLNTVAQPAPFAQPHNWPM